MRENILQQKKYSTGKGSYQLFLPLDYEVIIPENDSVRLLSLIMEELNYTELYKAYSREGRKPATEPKVLAKVLIYAYMEIVYSTRKIENACRRDINFMWLLGGEPVPDHSTISRFRKERLGAAIEGLFYQFIEKLCELGEVNYEDVFVDGTKIEASANRYTFVWKKAVEKNEAKMLLKVQALAEELLKVYHVDFAVSKETVKEDMSKMAVFLEQKKREENIEFVQGSGKRKSNLQKLLEALYTYQGRQMGYDESKKIFGGRNSYSKTDKDATFMRMKDDHMRNGQLKPAYNVQLAVEAEYVVGVGIFSNPTDTATLKPMLENMHEHTNRLIKRLTADSGYESEENYMYLESKGIEYYIKPQTYEQQKKRSFKNNIGKRENMAYNAETDEYTCHNQKKLNPVHTFNRKSSTENRQRDTSAR
jgi:transposase